MRYCIIADCSIEEVAIKALFSTGPSQGLRLIIAMVLATILMVADHKGEHVSGVRKAIGTALTPVLFVAQAPNAFYQWFSEIITTRETLVRENKALQDELFLQQTQVQRLVSLEAENARLRNLLGAARKTRGKRLVAEIIDVDLDSVTQQVLLNRGQQDEVFVGQAVLDAYGVLGQVVEVSHFASRVLLLTDARHAMPVRIERTGFNAIIEGAGARNRLKLRYVPDNSDVREGDLLVSSGLGQRFPDGYPVGQIESIRRDTGESYADITVLTAARMEHSGEVMLLWPTTPWRAGSSASTQPAERKP